MSSFPIPAALGAYALTALARELFLRFTILGGTSQSSPVTICSQRVDPVGPKGMLEMPDLHNQV